MSSGPDPSRLPADNPPSERLVKGQEVSLGCGTLILIALIVLFFGRGGTGDLEREVRGMRSEVGELKKAVENQTGQIKAMQDKLDKVKAKE
jgi:Sec-independent protein translocase protein TatA